MIGSRLALEMQKQGEFTGRAVNAWCDRVIRQLVDNRGRLTPEIVADFAELLPFYTREENLQKTISHAEIILWDDVIFRASSAGHLQAVGGDHGFGVAAGVALNQHLAIGSNAETHRGVLVRMGFATALPAAANLANSFYPREHVFNIRSSHRLAT